MQILIKLHIHDNQIGPEGVEHLANALQQNKVIVTQHILSRSIV
jgi:hypothetical protein